MLATEDPIVRFRHALERAEAAEPDVPSAMTLATVDEAGFPSARVVLLRGVDAGGFVFYTSYQSRKGRELEANPRAALCFHWKSLREQVRVGGTVERVSDAESDAYFASRPQPSQLAALASDQSAPLPDRATLESRHAALVARYGGASAPRPAAWGGFRLRPQRIEFWRHGEHRLHHRELFERCAEGWSHTLLYP